MPESTTLYTRWEHGNKPVKVITEDTGRRTFEYEGTAYTSARSLLKAVTGRNYHHTFDQYFRCSTSEAKPRTTVLDLFGKPPEEEEKFLEDLAGTFEAPVDNREGLGIDLATRGHEVRKLMFKSFYGHLAAKGYDPDDVLQEIYKGLLARNAGKCPWDGRKSTFGYYVTMVCRGVIYNYHAKLSKRLDREAVELTAEMPLEAPSSSLDNGSDHLAREALTKWLIQHHGGTKEGLMAPQVLPLLVAGYTREEMSKKLGISMSLVSKTTKFIRERSAEWAVRIGAR